MTQTERGNRYALTALRHKRAKLAGEIAALEKQAKWKRTQLQAVDATLGLFGQADTDSIKPVRTYQRVALFKQGELSQHVRDALRRGGKPMALGAIVESVNAALGHEAVAIHALRHRVRATLQYLWRDKGAVTKTGSGHRVTWGLKEG
jgi:hypothetical protein